MKLPAATLGALALPLLALAAVALPAASEQLAAPPEHVTSIIAMRRLTEGQYRNSIADIFGSDIRVAGRFEPIVRPVHELIASGARDSAISPAGIEQFDAMARGISAQVFDVEHRSQFVPCKPANESAGDAACARATLLPLGRYLFRRTLTAAEADYFVGLAGRAAGESGSFAKGLELSLGSMLISPRFLYLVETAEPDPAGGLRLDNYARAQRLSFMLWNTTPDETLLDAAEAGKLTDLEVLAATAQRMVDSPRFEQGVRAFFADMLLFEKFDELAKDPVIYPYFNQDVAQALPEQTLRTISDHLLARGGDYRELFTTPRTFMTRSLGGLYRVPVRRQQGWEAYTFAADDDRAGLLGQAGFLAMYSHSGRSSPTLRGRAIREVLMCQPVPNPPGNVNFTAVQDVANKSMPTARIRLNAHMNDPVCSGCHKLTDPVGLSLERFDGIGGFRAAENGAAIDAAGAIGPVSFFGAAGLGKTLAASPETTQCLASRALEYANGKPSEDEAQLDDLESRFASSGYTIRALFLRVATMPATWRVTSAPALVAAR